jgi:hypothetical protein
MNTEGVDCCGPVGGVPEAAVGPPEIPRGNAAGASLAASLSEATQAASPKALARRPRQWVEWSSFAEWIT